MICTKKRLTLKISLVLYDLLNNKFLFMINTFVFRYSKNTLFKNTVHLSINRYS